MEMLDLREFFAVLYDLVSFSFMSTIYFIETLLLTFIPRSYRSKNLREEIALITGAASGIGRLISIKLAKRGCGVVLWDINKTGLFCRTFNEFFWQEKKLIVVVNFCIL